MIDVASLTGFWSVTNEELYSQPAAYVLSSRYFYNPQWIQQFNEYRKFTKNLYIKDLNS